MLRQWFAVLALAAAAAPPVLEASDAPYFVTYTHRMEDPGDLEISLSQVSGRPAGGNRFVSELLELEYGATSRWTTEFYLAGQGTAGEGALFTGWKWENRFRPLLGEHWINPVFYVEYSSGNAADKTLREIVGHDTVEDLAEPIAETRLEHEREIETRLILSSNFRGWNLSENLVAEKSLSHEPWEFGYAVAASRPLSLAPRSDSCRFCPRNFQAGLEMYGGLGTWSAFGLRGTSHYLAPTLAWHIPEGPTLKVSPSFGLNGNASGVLLRFTVAYEVEDIRRWFRRGE